MTGFADGAAQDVKMEGVDYAQAVLRPPFVTRAPISEDWLLYFVRRGEIVFSASDAPETSRILPAGSVIGMSATIAHSFGSATSPDARTTVGWKTAPLGADAAPGDVVVVVGRVPQARVPFMAIPDRVVTIAPADDPGLVARIAALIDLIAAELAQADATSSAIVRRLAEVTALEVGRYELARSVIFRDRPAGGGVDRRIWRAIAAFSCAPEQHWTVERMAEVAGMSRTSFAVHFRAMVGTTPLKSLRQLRMQRAAASLSHPNPHPVAALARELGYASDAAFCRAFAREFGQPPGHYREPAGPPSAARR